MAVGGAQHIGSSGGYHRDATRPSFYNGFQGAVVGGFLGVVYEKDEAVALRPVVEQGFRIFQAVKHRLQAGVVGQRGGAGADGRQRRPRTEDAHRGGRRQQGRGTSGAVRAGDEQVIAPVQSDGRRLQRSPVHAEGQSPLQVGHGTGLRRLTQGNPAGQNGDGRGRRAVRRPLRGPFYISLRHRRHLHVIPGAGVRRPPRGQIVHPGPHPQHGPVQRVGQGKNQPGPESRRQGWGDGPGLVGGRGRRHPAGRSPPAYLPEQVLQSGFRQGGPQLAQIVGQQNQPRWGRRGRVLPHPVPEHRQQALQPFGVAQRDDGAGVRQMFQLRQPSPPAVQPVDMQLVGSAGGGQRTGCSQQPVLGSHPRLSYQQQVAVGGGKPTPRDLTLPVGLVGYAQRRLRSPVRGRVGEGRFPEGQVGAQRRGPGSAGGGAPHFLPDAGGGRRQPGQIGFFPAGGVRVRGGGRNRLDHAEQERGNPGLRARLPATGNQGRLKMDRLLRAASYKTPPGEGGGQPGRQPGPRARSQHVFGVGRGLHPQADAQVDVGSDGIFDHAGRLLGGQRQVHPQAASPLGYVHQGFHKAGQFPGQQGELVDDHRQTGQGPVGSVPSQLIQVGRPRLPQPLLPPGQFRFQRTQGAFPQTFVQVGHQPHRVRQVGAGVESRPAFVVDQDQVEKIGAVTGGQRGDEGAQQFAFAGTGGARQQAVRPVRRQIHQQRAGFADADGGGQARGRGVGRPSDGDGGR